MIHVLEMPCDAPPRVWFAFDADDLARKLEASDVAELHAAGRCRVFADESRPQVRSCGQQPGLYLLGARG